MQLAIDSLDRLVELVEERGGRVAAGDAARELFALGRTTDAVARSLLGPLVEGDDRLVWRGASVALAASPSPRLEEASFCVFAGFTIEIPPLSGATRLIVAAADLIPVRPGSANVPALFCTAANLRWFLSV